VDARVGGIVFDCASPRRVATFWRDAIGFRVRHQPDEPEDPDLWRSTDPDDAFIVLADPERNEFCVVRSPAAEG
jgi:Glyoxalase-like domain